MATFISRSPAETESFAERIGAACPPGSVIGLVGDLGAGKTQFVKGLARGVGFLGRVHSPTFALMNCYEGGRSAVFHLDLYRLESHEAIERAGLGEYFTPDGIAVVEWFDRWGGTVPERFQLYRFEIISDTERAIHYGS